MQLLEILNAAKIIPGEKEKNKSFSSPAGHVVFKSTANVD